MHAEALVLQPEIVADAVGALLHGEEQRDGGQHVRGPAVAAAKRDALDETEMLERRSRQATRPPSKAIAFFSNDEV